MLRRDFFKIAASFVAATTAARETLAALKAPEERVGEFLRDMACPVQNETTGAALVPVEFADAIAEAMELRSQFERTLVECLRDGSMVLVGVSGCHVGYEAFYRPAKFPGEGSLEQARHDALLEMHDRGAIIVDSVTCINHYSGVNITFATCPCAPLHC